MSVAETWVEALQIDPEKLNEWSSLAPEGVPMLVWCLQEGHISAELYLAWASRRFELPVVRPEYFNEAFDAAMALQLHKEVSAAAGREWSPWFFPVEKWENVTLVACVEPPPEFEEPGFRCILADARSLKDAWYRFMAPHENETSASRITAPEMPIGMETSQVHTVVKPFKLSLDNLEGENMFVHKEPNKDELYSGYKDEETSAKPAAPPLPKDQEDDEKSMVAEVLSAKTPPPEPEVDEEGSRMHTHLDLSQLAHLPPTPEAPRVRTPPVPVAQPKSGTKPKAPPPTPAKKPSKALSTPDLEALIQDTFTQLSGLYKNSFIMRCQDDHAVLHKWDSGLKPTKQNISIDLAFPTFFRIVNKTHLPYHGYLVDSPAHRSFFAELNMQELPDCVTALPIKNEETLIGVLVCIGDEPLQKLEMLKKVEDAATNLVHALEASWGGAKAA